MKRARRIAIAISILTAGCTALINVPDLELQATSDGGVDGNVANHDASVVTDGGEGTDADNADSGACGGADLASDPNNCGACGHSCNGLQCTAGACTPLVLADNLGAAYMMDIADPTYLYFSVNDHSSIQRVKKDGSAKPEVLVDTGITSPLGVHIAGNMLYFASQEGVHSCDVTNAAISCTSTLARIASSSSGATDLIAADGLLYWGDNDSKVFRALPDGGAKATILPDLNTNYPFKLAIGGGFIYVSSPYDSYSIVAARIDGGALQDAGNLDSTNTQAYIAADDAGYGYTYVDYLNGQGMVWASDHATKAPKSVTPTGAAAGKADGVALDGQYIYWTDIGTFDSGSGNSNNDGTVKRCLRTGCTGDPTVVMNGLRGGGELMLDDKYIYVIENNAGNASGANLGRIRKALKP